VIRPRFSTILHQARLDYQLLDKRKIRRAPVATIQSARKIRQQTLARAKAARDTLVAGPLRRRLLDGPIKRARCTNTVCITGCPGVPAMVADS